MRVPIYGVKCRPATAGRQSPPPTARRRGIGAGARTALALGSLGLAASASTAAPPRPNFLLVTLDTTRADHLGAWGWPHARTPQLDALAARGTRFAHCEAAAPVTLPSHATILTGLYPPRHGVRDNGTFALPESIATVAERLAAAGYDTAAVVSAVVLARRHGLDQGFRIYDDDLGPAQPAAGERAGAGGEASERLAAATTEAAVAALGALREPWLLWVHYFDPHEQYLPPAPFAAAAAGPHPAYDGEIAYLDDRLGALLSRLPPATVVAAVGDHGEMLGEGGELTHGLLLGPGARRVPLILAGPGVPEGARSDCLVRTADLAPTLLALAGVPVPPGLDGEPLLPLPVAGPGCHRLAYSESFLPYFAYKWYPLRALSDGRRLFLQAPRPALFDLEADPRQERDLASRRPVEAEDWARRLAALLAAMGEPVHSAVRSENLLDAEGRRQLASLGYLGAAAGGAAPAAVGPELPDPRTMTSVARALHEAARQVEAGRHAKALPALQDIVRRDPRNFPALTLAGLCLREAGKLEAALALFQAASREQELSAVPVANAAGVLLALGKRAEAEREYRHALALDPSLPEAASNLGRLLREKGSAAEAIALLDGALAAGAHAGEIYLERGLARAEAGRLAAALADFREAARRGPGDPVPLENAARAAYHLGRHAEAAGLYEQVLRLAPDRGDLWKTLGAVYLDGLGDGPAALAAFRRALALEADPAERARLEAILRGLGG